MPSYRTKGFLEFVREWRQKNARGMSLPQAVDRCNGIWAVMNQEQRTPYHLLAKSINEMIRAQFNHPMVVMDRARREAEERQEQKKRDVEDIVMEAVNNNDLENLNMILISFNFFSKSVRGDLYVPAEFSACQFSLKQGIVSEYSTLINPGSLELGQANDALHHSSTTHQLPLPPHALGEGNIRKLCREIGKYLTNSMQRSSQPLFVFTKGENCLLVEAALDDLQLKSDQWENRISVLSIEYLLFFLKKQTCQIAGLPVDDITEITIDSYLKQDQYEFATDIACEYHEYIDRSQYCTQSCVKRWAYSICDYLCSDLNITKEPGKHIPPYPSPVSDSDGDPGPEKDNQPSMEVKLYKCLAGFGRGKARGRLPTLGEAQPR